MIRTARLAQEGMTRLKMSGGNAQSSSWLMSRPCIMCALQKAACRLSSGQEAVLHAHTPQADHRREVGMPAHNSEAVVTAA